jgi:Tol biopolymer transport system component
MSPDGRIVAFASTATVLGVTSGVQEIYERDTCQGAGTGCTAHNVPVSESTAGKAGNALSENPSISSTGQYVAFASLASNLVTTNVGGIENIYVRNSCVEQASTCVSSTVLISQSATDVPGNAASLNPVINSEGGTIVAFYSAASNLVADDVNGFPDIFLAFSTF